MTVYSNSARFDNARALTEEEMFQKAPSIFATTPHESRSDRFVPVPTISVLRGLMNEGFMPVGVKQSVTRVPGKAEFTKHLIRMRRLDNETAYKVGDNVCEILLKNANDGTSAYDLMAGLFRIRCLNSLVSQTAELDSLKVRHSGNPTEVAHRVIEGTYSVLDTAKRLLEAPEAWGQICLNHDQRMAYATAAHTLRFGNTDSEPAMGFPVQQAAYDAGIQLNGERPREHPIKPSALLTVRRQGDSQPDLWSTFNVVQENAIKGGLRGAVADTTTRRGFRRMTTRPVNGIDADVKLNKALWVLTAEMARLAA